MAGSACGVIGPHLGRMQKPAYGDHQRNPTRGGTGGQFMARLGYAAIIIEGERKTDDLWKIVITKDSGDDLKM